MQTPRTDTAALLREILTERMRQNTRYSMRAFAKALGLSPGGLSLILARKKRLSVDRAHVIARKLGLSSDDTRCFLLSVELEGATSIERKAELHERLGRAKKDSKLFDLGIDQFRLISEWYGLPLLVLFTERSPLPGRKEAARLLSIPVGEVDAMLARLERLELIERTGGTDEHPIYGRVEGTIRVESAAPNEALRNYHRGVLARNEESIDSQTSSEKVIGAQVFAFDPEQLDEARALADRFLDDLGALAAKGKCRTEIYQAYCSVFRLTSPPVSPSPNPRKEIP